MNALTIIPTLKNIEIIKGKNKILIGYHLSPQPIINGKLTAGIKRQLINDQSFYSFTLIYGAEAAITHDEVNDE
jgi:hypothetical protein